MNCERCMQPWKSPVHRSLPTRPALIHEMSVYLAGWGVPSLANNVAQGQYVVPLRPPELSDVLLGSPMAGLVRQNAYCVCQAVSDK